MKEITLHLLDLVMNCTRAGADYISISVVADRLADTLTFEVSDNGSGIAKDRIGEVINPFYSGRSTRKIGLGIPLLKQNAELTGGKLTIESEEGHGTKVSALFILSNIDKPPTGNLAELFAHLCCGTAGVDFTFSCRNGSEAFSVTTLELKEALDIRDLKGSEIKELLTQLFDSNIESTGLKGL